MLCGRDRHTGNGGTTAVPKEWKHDPNMNAWHPATGRRTFIRNALTMGIPPSLVMEWTGHSDYKAMKPYIKIADKEKARAMKLFDEQ